MPCSDNIGRRPPRTCVLCVHSVKGWGQEPNVWQCTKHVDGWYINNGKIPKPPAWCPLMHVEDHNPRQMCSQGGMK